jgi:hypothetical protein
MNKKSTSKKQPVVARKVEPVVGLRWVDTFGGAEYEISGVTEDNISYGHTPGQRRISGGAHCPKAWAERVRIGQYIIQPKETENGIRTDTLRHNE